jgi:hypothetical protein
VRTHADAACFRAVGVDLQRASSRHPDMAPGPAGPSAASLLVVNSTGWGQDVAAPTGFTMPTRHERFHVGFGAGSNPRSRSASAKRSP